MMNRGKFRPSFFDRLCHIVFPDYIMTYLAAMRKVCYYKNRRGVLNRFKYLFYHKRFSSYGLKLGFSIGYDVFGYGLLIPHYGTIVVGSPNQIGNYAVLHTSICITGNGKVIGDGLYCATGAKITSPIVLGNSISVCANSVVNKSFERGNALIGGMPACFIREEESWYIRDHYQQRVNLIEARRKELGIK